MWEYNYLSGGVLACGSRPSLGDDVLEMAISRHRDGGENQELGRLAFAGDGSIALCLLGDVLHRLPSLVLRRLLALYERLPFELVLSVE